MRDPERDNLDYLNLQSQLQKLLPLNAMMTQLGLDRFDSPLGEILLITDGVALCALDFGDYEHRMLQLLGKTYPRVEFQAQVNPLGWRDRLLAYFSGDFSSLDDLPVNPGGTAFQRQVWLALRAIAPGTTISYGELAQRLGKPTAARAVGMTNALNPISIVLPCHRVIGAKGQLTGYAGGIDRKRWLLNHERQIHHARTVVSEDFLIQP